MLEDRDCPAASGFSFEALVLPNHLVQLNGQVSGEHAANAVVSFSGAVTDSVIADENGNFTLTTSAATEGAVYAIGLYDGQAFSPEMSAWIDVAAPSIDVAITDITANTVTFSGTLFDIDVANQALTINGASVSVATDCEGKFSFTLNRAGLDAIEVSETNLWGETSNVALIDVPTAPVILAEFHAAHLDFPGNRWEFSGRVEGGDPNYEILIALGGLEGLDEWLMVDEEGWFYVTVDLPIGVSGFASAQAWQFGLGSNICYENVN